MQRNHLLRSEIDDSDFREKFEYDDEKPDSFSLKALWEYLEFTYGGQAGEDVGWRQTAAVLVYEFGMKYKKQVVRKAGRTIIELSVYLDDFDKKYSGKNRLHYNSNDKFVKTMSELKSFATWHQNMALAHDIGMHVTKFWHDRYEDIVSRKQYPLGDDQEIILVTFHNKFEFRFSDACAAQLQLFLGTYGNLNEE